MKTLIELRLFLIKNKEKREIVVRIYEPIKGAVEHDVFCAVDLDGLLKSTKKIYGVDERQAWNLATEFVGSFLSEYEVQSEDGRPLSLQDAFKSRLEK